MCEALVRFQATQKVVSIDPELKILAHRQARKSTCHFLAQSIVHNDQSCGLYPRQVTMAWR